MSAAKGKNMRHNITMKWFVLLASAFILLTEAPFVHAQSSLTGSLDPVKFIIAPEVPGPNETVRIEAQGIGTFLGDATITWRVNGVTALSGAGERTLDFTTGELGVRTVVDVVISSPSKGTISRSFIFIPSVVNLIWEADTSTPPLFRGKPLYSAGSPLTITAFPTVIANGRTISSNNFSFQWSRNGGSLPNQSGLGRNTLSFIGDQLRDREVISVDVRFENVLVGRGSITIPAVKPMVLLYQRDPLLGVRYDNALPSPFSLAEAETSLLAQPYYFSNTSIKNDYLSFVWEIQGKEVVGPSTAEGLITLRQTGSGSGANTLKVELQNLDPQAYIQSAETIARIMFGEQRNSILPSIFGL